MVSRQAEYQRRWKADGLCTQGCRREAAEGKWRCRECAERYNTLEKAKRSTLTKEQRAAKNAYFRRYYAHLKEQGFCTYGCGRKAREGKIACVGCAKKLKAKHKATYVPRTVLIGGLGI